MSRMKLFNDKYIVSRGKLHCGEFVKGISHSLCNFFKIKRSVAQTNNIYITREVTVRETVEVPDFILVMMNDFDEKLKKAGVQPFYANYRQHRRIGKKPYETFNDYKFICKVLPDNVSVFDLTDFYKATAIRNIISNNNLDIRITNSCDLICWFKTKADIAKFKMLCSDTIFGEIIDICEIEHIDNEISKLFSLKVSEN